MSADNVEQPAVGAVEQGECPRNRWYQEEGRQLRAAGWHLRKHGDKWNATHALIERRAAAVDSRKPSLGERTAFASTDWLAAFESASNAVTAAAVAAEKAGEKWAMYEANKAWWLLSAVMDRGTQRRKAANSVLNEPSSDK